MNEDDERSALRDDLGKRIRENDRGQVRMKIKTLLTGFGYQSNFRVRQSSLEEVLATMAGWGIATSFVDGRQAHDWITLTLATKQAPKEVEQPNPEVVLQPHHLEPDACLDPFVFLFRMDDRIDRGRSDARFHDMMAAVWSCSPVCLLITGSEEYFTFAAGYLAAAMRRRALMIRRGDSESMRLPLTPRVLTGNDLQTLRGKDLEGTLEIPEVGGVYVIKDDPEDLRDDELASFIREVAVPHTYRAVARFDATLPRPGVAEDRTASKDARWSQVRSWFASYAGAPDRAEEIGRVSDPATVVTFGALMANVEQARQALLSRIAFARTDAGFKGGWESAEHLLLKSAITTAFRGTYGSRLEVEAAVTPTDDDHDGPQLEAWSTKRPDIYVADELWVEVETLRGLGRRGSDPFFALETKLRGKLRHMSRCGEKWLVVPSDLAMLARDQVCAVARNLAEDLRVAFWDVQQRRFVAMAEREQPELDLDLSGMSWDSPRTEPRTPRLRWTDVAGYRDLQQRLRQDVVEPFVEVQRYLDHGIGTPAGVLLYGLPGCGKSLIGRVLAGESDVDHRFVVPSDLTSMWIGEGVGRIRELFDWARKRAPCVLVIDEIDGVAPVRSEHSMHSDEKRQVNELLVQLDKVGEDRVLVVATTNYVRGIDHAIRRAGRFDTKIAVFPPDRPERAEIFTHYLGRLRGVGGIETIDVEALAEASMLHTPADIRVVVELVARRAIAAAAGLPPCLNQDRLLDAIARHPRTIRSDEGWRWVAEAKLELPATDERLKLLEGELETVYGRG